MRRSGHSSTGLRRAGEVITLSVNVRYGERRPAAQGRELPLANVRFRPGAVIRGSAHLAVISETGPDHKADDDLPLGIVDFLAD